MMEVYHIVGDKHVGDRQQDTKHTRVFNRTLVFDWCGFDEDQRQNTTQREVFECYWTTCSNLMKYSTFDSEHNWEDLYSSFKNQQTCTCDNHN